jgi:hypothetical protein
VLELLSALANASGWAVAIFTLLLVLRAIAIGQLVPGPTHQQALKREEWWRDRALAGTSLAEKATDVAEAATDAG